MYGNEALSLILNLRFPPIQSIRVLFWSANAGFYLVVALYSCDLMASMVSRRPPAPLRNFAEVLSSGLRVTYPAGSVQRSVLEDRAHPVRRRVFEELSFEVEGDTRMVEEAVIAGGGEVAGFSSSMPYTMGAAADGEGRLPVRAHDFEKISKLVILCGFRFLTAPAASSAPSLTLRTLSPPAPPSPSGGGRTSGGRSTITS